MRGQEADTAQQTANEVNTSSHIKKYLCVILFDSECFLDLRFILLSERKPLM